MLFRSLTELLACGTQVSNISQLAGMPLKRLNLFATSVTDLRPLLSCPDLEILGLPSPAKDVGQLRALKKLKRLSERWDYLPSYLFPDRHDPGTPAQTAEEYWMEYDAQQAAGK